MFCTVVQVNKALSPAKMCMIGMDQFDTELHESVARAVEDFENHSEEIERRVFPVATSSILSCVLRLKPSGAMELHAL
jgi:hypothetical protein